MTTQPPTGPDTPLYERLGLTLRQLLELAAREGRDPAQAQLVIDALDNATWETP